MKAAFVSHDVEFSHVQAYSSLAKDWSSFRFHLRADQGESKKEDDIQRNDDVADNLQAVELVGQLMQQDGSSFCAHATSAAQWKSCQPKAERPADIRKTSPVKRPRHLSKSQSGQVFCLRSRSLRVRAMHCSPALSAQRTCSGRDSELCSADIYALAAL